VTVERSAVDAALATVHDPEIHRPITELGMVDSVRIDGGTVTVRVLLTVGGCPMRDTITHRVVTAVSAVDAVTDVEVELGVMTDEQRTAMRERLQGPGKEIPFAKPGSLTRVIAVTSGKGGVGKSSITVNLAVAMAQRGKSIGIVDADVYGHSVPRMLGITSGPTRIDASFMMPPESFGVKAISMLPFKRGGSSEPVLFRGPMLHRVLQQFLSDFYWGDLDVLLLDLPPGTGDIAMSLAQLLPDSELVIVTTPQPASAEVAVRAGMVAAQTHQKVLGVIENMSSTPCPHCGEPLDLFGFGGGQVVADVLTRELGTSVPLMSKVPFDVRLREGGDSGRPLVIDEPESPAARAIFAMADALLQRPRGLVGKTLSVTPTKK
jgi:ATP-binding protein involved in chromosome partitioning